MQLTFVRIITRHGMIISSLMVCLGCWVSDVKAQQSAEKVEILGRIADGTQPPPKPPKELPNLAVVNEIIHPDKGRIIRMQRVEDPGYPDPQPKPNVSVQSEVDEEAFWASLSDEQKAEIEARNNALTFSLSATVVDYKATRLRWRHEGEEFEAWSNVDFNHLTGFAQFKVDGRYYDPYFGIGNTSSEIEGTDVWPGRIPNFSTTEPTYIVIRGDASNMAAMEGIDALHALYRVEHQRLKEAYEKRELAHRERQRYLEANPPKPKDVRIQFWKRDVSKNSTKEESP